MIVFGQSLLFEEGVVLMDILHPRAFVIMYRIQAGFVMRRYINMAKFLIIKQVIYSQLIKW